MMASDTTCYHCGVTIVKTLRVLIDVEKQRVFQQFFDQTPPPCSWLCRKCNRLLNTLVKTKQALDARQREDSSTKPANDQACTNPTKKRKREDDVVKPVS